MVQYTYSLLFGRAWALANGLVMEHIMIIIIITIIIITTIIINIYIYMINTSIYIYIYTYICFIIIIIISIIVIIIIIIGDLPGSSLLFGLGLGPCSWSPRARICLLCY